MQRHSLQQRVASKDFSATRRPGLVTLRKSTCMAQSQQVFHILITVIAIAVVAYLLVNNGAELTRYRSPET
jgi:hypothetical protein